MSINPSDYVESTVFNREVDNIFNQRLYVGSTFDYPAHGYYRSFFCGGRPVSVRNIDGRINAFDNVCLHRASLIDPPGNGQKPFRCGYHGWEYGQDGTIVRAPFADDKCINRRGLTTFPTASSDGFIFCGLKDVGPDIEEVGPILRKLDFSYAEPFFKSTLDHACNWKLMVENVLESYHLSFVHPNSFVQSGVTTTSPSDWSAGKYTSFSSIAAHKASADGLKKIASDAAPGYRHAYVFPNLFISVTSSLIGFVSHFIPTTAKSTLLEWELIELPLLQKQRNAVREYIRNEAIRFTTTALNEDKKLLEMAQLGIAYARAPHQLQPMEARVLHFHEVYEGAMSNA